jgi:hypothetical protein
VAWFITGFAFAGDVSQTMGFGHFLDKEISGRWLDVMFASFVAEPDEVLPGVSAAVAAEVEKAG